MSPSRVPLLSCAQIPPSTCYAGYLSHVAQDFDFHLLYCFNYIPISQSSVCALLISCSSMDSQYLQKNKPVDHWVQTETWTLSSEWGTRVNVVIKKWEDMSPANMVLTPKRAPNHLDLLKPHSVTLQFWWKQGFCRGAKFCRFTTLILVDVIVWFVLTTKGKRTPLHRKSDGSTKVEPR